MAAVGENNNDYEQLQIETREIVELIKKTRAEFDLLPIFKAKKRSVEATSPEDSEAR